MADAAPTTPGRRSLAARLGIDGSLLWQLAAIAVAAFVIRLVPVLLTGGLHGIIDYDDSVYMGAALAFVDGRIPYRDFALLHPPGIVYLLSPFAALSWFTSDAAAFAAARLGFMALGAANTFLVGLVASRCGRRAALAAALLYAVWIVAVRVERSTWLIAPQSALLLLALLALTYPRSSTVGGPRVTWRKAAAVGVLIGLSCAIQIWGALVLAVVLAWLVVTTARQPGGWLRPAGAYAIAGSLTVLVAFLPFLLAAGGQMLRYVITDQLGLADRSRRDGRPDPGDGRTVKRARPKGESHRLGRGSCSSSSPALLFAAWRRPPMRLWVAFVDRPVGLPARHAVVLRPLWVRGGSRHASRPAAPSRSRWASRDRSRGARRRSRGCTRSVPPAGPFVAVAPKSVGFPSPSTPFGATPWPRSSGTPDAPRPTTPPS